MLYGAEPIVFSKILAEDEVGPKNGCGVVILGTVIVSNRFAVTGKKMETQMRAQVVNKLIQNLWNLKNDKLKIMELLQKVKEENERLEPWSLMGLGLSKIHRGPHSKIP